MEHRTPYGAIVTHHPDNSQAERGVMLVITMADPLDDRRAEVFLSMQNVWDLVNDLETEYL